MSKVVYTIGYEGRSIEDIAYILIENRVRRLIDVRRVPNKSRSEFRKDKLKMYLDELNIEYVHAVKYSPSSDLLVKYKYKFITFEEFIRKFSEYIDTVKLDDLVKLITEKRSCIMCYERYYKVCHRYVLSIKLEKLGFTVIHL